MREGPLEDRGGREEGAEKRGREDGVERTRQRGWGRENGAKEEVLGKERIGIGRWKWRYHQIQRKN